MTPRKPKADAAPAAAPAAVAVAGNGKTPAQLEQLVEPPAELAPAPASAPVRVVLDYDLLNMGDMMRARKMFAGLPAADQWSGSDPVALLAGHWEERQAVTIWCLRSRTDPTFTWEQACLVDFGELDFPEEPPPPPTPEPSTDGGPPDALSSGDVEPR